MSYLSLLAVIFPALVVLFGYVYQKRCEKEFEINKKRQEIYTRVIENFVEKLELLDRLRDDPDMPDRATTENVDQIMGMIRTKHHDLDANFNRGREIMSLLTLYGSDKAIKACADFYRSSYASMQPGSEVRPDKNEFIRQLRKSLFPATLVSAEDIRFITSK